jgi:uncharacterized protein
VAPKIVAGGGNRAGETFLKRDRAVAELTGCASEVRARGVLALYLFGSTARDAARDGSDVDIFIEADPDARFNAFDLIDVKTILERRLAAHVDLTTRDGLHPRLRDRIEREAIRVF